MAYIIVPYNNIKNAKITCQKQKKRFPVLTCYFICKRYIVENIKLNKYNKFTLRKEAIELKKRIICVTLILVFMFSMTSYASENSDIPDSTIEVKLSEEEVIALKTELATCKDYESQIANTYSVKNYYESNDTIATAYPYENTEKIKHQDGEWQGHFGCTHDSDTNWFAVEPDGTIDERPLIGSSKPSCSLQ